MERKKSSVTLLSTSISVTSGRLTTVHAETTMKRLLPDTIVGLVRQLNKKEAQTSR